MPASRLLGQTLPVPKRLIRVVLRQTPSLWSRFRTAFRAGYLDFSVFPRHLRPRTYVSNTSLVTGDDNFCSFQDRSSIFHPRTADSPSSGLRIDQFSRAAFANRH